MYEVKVEILFCKSFLVDTCLSKRHMLFVEPQPFPPFVNKLLLYLSDTKLSFSIFCCFVNTQDPPPPLSGVSQVFLSYSQSEHFPHHKETFVYKETRDTQNLLFSYTIQHVYCHIQRQRLK